MKKLFLLAVFGICLSTQVRAEKIVVAYACECSSSKKICDGLENLNLKLIKNGRGQILLADIGNSDWEFNDSFKSMRYARDLPDSVELDFTAYKVIEGASHIPDVYAESDLLISNGMVPSEVALSSKTGEARLLNSKNRTAMRFDCEKINPNNF